MFEVMQQLGFIRVLHCHDSEFVCSQLCIGLLTRAVASVGPGGGGPAPPDKVLAPPGWPGAVYRKFTK